VDMWGPYRLSIEQWAVNCRIVYDKFHIMQHAILCPRCGWAAFHSNSGECIDALRLQIAELQFKKAQPLGRTRCGQLHANFVGPVQRRREVSYRTRRGICSGFCSAALRETFKICFRRLR